MTDNDLQKFMEIWGMHQSDQWPGNLGAEEGHLMTLDTVIGGCVSFYLEEYRLDEQRVDILRDCLAELEGLVAELPDESLEYFRRLRYLGVWLLQDYS